MTYPRDAGPPPFEVHLPLGLDAPARARAHLRAWWTSSGGESGTVLDDAVLVVDELVSNALLHGAPNRHGEIEFSGRVENGYLVLSVFDNGSAGTVQALAGNAEAERGRGLSIVAAVSTGWHVDRTDGTCVTARIRL